MLLYWPFVNDWTQVEKLWQPRISSTALSQRTNLLATLSEDWERTFCLAYGHEKMLAETRDALLHGQLQEGLRQHLMEASAMLQRMRNDVK